MYEELFEIKPLLSDSPRVSSLRLAYLFGEQHSKTRDRIAKFGIPHTRGSFLSQKGMPPMLWLTREGFNHYLVNKNGDQAKAMCAVLGLTHKSRLRTYVKKVRM